MGHYVGQLLQFRRLLTSTPPSSSLESASCPSAYATALNRPVLLEARQRGIICTLGLMPHLVKVTLEKYILAQQSICCFFCSAGLTGNV